VHWSLQVIAALAMFGISAGMILYERSRLRAARFPVSEGGRVFYWMTYLSLLVLGVTVLLSAMIR